MDIAIEQTGWPHRLGEARQGPSAPAPLDWHGLCARLLAAQACRRELADAALAGEPAASGSFDCALAQLIAANTVLAGEMLNRVNPTGLADGKPTRSIRRNTAGAVPTGDRGLT